MIFLVRKLQDFGFALIHISPRILVFWTVAQFFLFGLMLYLAEDPGAKITEPINFWYFWWVTVLTVGYGDLSPGTNMAKLFAPLFMASGIILLGTWLTKAGMVISEREANKRRGLMPTRATNHIVVIGDHHHTRTMELLGNIIHDRKNDGKKMPAIVCMFRNTGDGDPFNRSSPDLQGVEPEYHQAPKNGFNAQALVDVNVEGAILVYVSFEDDMSALAAICALSRTNLVKTHARIGVLLRESSNEELIPQTDLNLALIKPVQQALVVRELEDPGTGQMIADLIDVRQGNGFFSAVLSWPGLATSYKTVRECFGQMFGERVLVVGLSKKVGSGWHSVSNPPASAQMEDGDRIVYIAAQDLSDEEVESFSMVLGATSRINRALSEAEA